MTTQRERLMKIETLNSDDLEAYLVATHRSTLPQYDKNELIVACEERLTKLDRSVAIVERGEIKVGEI